MRDYIHTQPGTLMRIVFGGGTVVVGAIALILTQRQPSAAYPLLAVAAVMGACLLLFDSLTVSVSRQEIQLWFGVGLISKRFAVADIEHAEIVRNHWMYGWGIRYTPHGWLYNVSGFDAVQIRLTNGRQYRIGSDEPAELLRAIERARGER